MKIRIVLLALAVLAAAGVVVAATRGPGRPALRLPAASAFPDGPCRDAAEAVLALGRFTYDHEDATKLPASAYPFLRQRSEELAGVRKALTGDPAAAAAAGAAGEPDAGEPDAGEPDGAGQAVSRRIDAVLTAIGFVRLRPGKAYDPQLLRDLETARAELQQSCVQQA